MRDYSIISLLLVVCMSCSGQKQNLNKSDQGRFHAGQVISYRMDSTLKSMMTVGHFLNQDSVTLENAERRYVKSLGTAMGFPFLTNGSGCLNIRLWVWDLGKNYVVNIIDDSLKKYCQVIQFKLKEKADSNEYYIIIKEAQYLRPVSGWSHFFRVLRDYDIPFLKSGKSYKNQTKALTGMALVQFEVANPGSYKFYQYTEPAFYMDEDEGAKKVFDFIHFFDKEMKLRIYSMDENRLRSKSKNTSK